MKASFKKKYGNWALVTGATSGIGAELAAQIAAMGLNIVLVARKNSDLQNYSALLRGKFRIETQTVSADLATEAGVEAVKQIGTDVGLLVHAAGLEANGAFEKTPLDREVNTIHLNVMATLQLTHHFVKGMVERGRGGILLVSSLSGHMPNPYFANYAGSKAYVLNLGASLYGELKPKGVDVTVLSPGLTKTPMVADNGMDFSKTPLKPMEPSVVAAAALSGLGKRVITIPGARNKMMAMMMRFSPLRMAIWASEKMVRNAIDKTKI